MATNYPTSADTLTNPTASDHQNSPSHASQHANANDAIEALEAKLGTGSSTAAANQVLRGTGTGATAFGQVATGDIADSAVTVPKTANPYRARAYLSGAQSPTSGAIVQILFDAESYDSNSNFASNKYTAPVSGYYLVTVNVTVASTAANQRVIAYIYKNGSAYSDCAASTGVATNNGATVTDIVYLAATDYVDGRVYQDGGSKSLVNAATSTFMSVHLLSPA